jgi:excisionase family DNA binding protein
MTIKDFSEQLGKPESTVRTWIRRGELSPLFLKRIGSTVFIKAEKFKEWVDKDS